MENKKANKIHGFVFIASVALLSVSLISSIGIWKNRSFYFDEYIYNNHLASALTSYCADLDRYISGQMMEDEKESFQEQTVGVYYYVTDDNTKEVYSNIPESVDYTEFSARTGIKTLNYVTEDSDIINIYGFLTKTVQEDNNNKSLSGHIFIDLDTGPLLSGSFRYQIDTGFSQQRVLYIETVLFAISFIIGGVMLIVSLSNMKNIASLVGRIPLDVAIAAPAGSGLVWILFINTYLKTLRTFSLLGRRIILYSVLVALTSIILFFVIGLLSKARIYAADKTKFKREWENRLTKNVPLWLIGLILQLIWYFVILTAFAPGPSVYDYVNLLKTNIMIIIFHNALIIAVFLFMRKLWRTKTLYADEVLSAAQEIAKGNFERTIPVIGGDSYAQIALAANEIREGYMCALDQQKKSERLKYELVTNISHDLRTPLTSIINYIGLVKRGEMPNDMKRYIGLVDANAKKLNLLIEDLFELSKIESGNMELNISEADIVLLLKQIAHEYEEKSKQNGLEIIMDFSSEHCFLKCDSLKIWRVFDNIINNAIKYSLSGTRIYITAAEKGGSLEVSVKNIASYKMNFEPEDLFLRFKRGDDSRSTEGSGLGLAIAKGLVELHNGRVCIETEGDMFKVIVKLKDIPEIDNITVL